MMKRFFCLLLTLMSMAVSAGAAGELYTTATLHGHNSENISWNHYDECANGIFSHLFLTPGGSLTRVEFIGEEGMMVEVYDANATLLSKRAIQVFPEVYGGFFAGEKYNFVVMGRVNEDAREQGEVLRVTKYDKNWKRLSSQSLLGADTVFPFAEGSLRMTELGDTLYIHTCHSRFPDGNSQSCMTVVMSQDCLGYLETQTDGEAANSINQFIQTDGTDLFRLDHCAEGQGAMLTKSALSDGLTAVCSETVFRAERMSLGSFALSGSSCLTAGEDGNIFLLATDKELEGTRLSYLTHYTPDGAAAVRTPHLVKLSDERFLILWEEEDRADGSVSVSMTTVDGSGRQTGQVVSAPLRLSDCQPIVTAEGKVQWYVADSAAPTLYTVDPAAIPTLDYTLRLEDADPADGRVTLRAEGLPDGAAVWFGAYDGEGKFLRGLPCTVSGGAAAAELAAESASCFKSFVLDGDLVPIRESKTIFAE